MNYLYMERPKWSVAMNVAIGDEKASERYDIENRFMMFMIGLLLRLMLNYLCVFVPHCDDCNNVWYFVVFGGFVNISYRYSP